MYATTTRRLLSPTATVTNGLNHPTRTLITSTTTTARRYSSSSSSKPSRNGLLPVRATSPLRRKLRQVDSAPAVPLKGRVTAVAPTQMARELVESSLPTRWFMKSMPTRKRRLSKIGRPSDATTWLPEVPAVPNTSHLFQTDIAKSSFFALHRPISILFPVPGDYTPKVFSTIFDDASPTSFIEMHQRQYEIQSKLAGNQSEPVEAETELSYANAAHSKASPSIRKAMAESPIQLPNHILVAKYQPFQPPPPPEPLPSWSIASNGSLQQILNQFEQTKPTSDSQTNQAHFDILSALRRHAQVFNHNKDEETRMFENPRPVQSQYAEQQAIRARMVHRRQAWEAIQRKNVVERLQRMRSVDMMETLSVKRQRRLKMKKHKYKKLMKKTRSLRRKLDKQ